MSPCTSDFSEYSVQDPRVFSSGSESTPSFPSLSVVRGRELQKKKTHIAPPTVTTRSGLHHGGPVETLTDRVEENRCTSILRPKECRKQES